MIKPLKEPKTGKSNRDHHLTFFKDDYEKFKWNFSMLGIAAEKLINEIKEEHARAIRVDASRRENAVYMGVAIAESDTIYSIDDVKKLVPGFIEDIKNIAKQLGVDL